MKHFARWLLVFGLVLLAGAGLVLIAGVGLARHVKAQHQPSGQQVVGAAQYRGTVNASVSITLGNTFQTILAVPAQNTTTGAVLRQSLTIQNNNTTDSCWLFIGSGTATKATSMVLLAGGSYQRYWPYVPADVIQATCTTTSDTLYVDYQ